MLKITPHLKEMHAVLEEISTAKENISKVISELDALDFQYQRGQLDYKKYTQLKNKILANKTREHIMTTYNLYMSSLQQRLLQLNSRILKSIYSDKSYESLVIGKEMPSKKGKSLPELDALQIAEIHIPAESLDIQKLKAKEERAEKKAGLEVPMPDSLETLPMPQPVKMNFFKRLIYAFQAKEKPWLNEDEQENIKFGGIFTKAFLDYLFAGMSKRPELFGQTTVLRSILSYEDQSRIDKEMSISKTDILDPYLLERQIKELKSLISKKKPDIYKASTIGYLANITVRRISIYFIEKYPEFFKKLYTAIRFANIRILANTYINIMFFMTLLLGMSSIPIFTVFFTFQGEPVGWVFVKTILSSLVVANLTFWMGFYYPFMKSKSRKRSINTNLPFAIDHMASVIASGVSPATMFKLISTSIEYGEISVEIEKVTSYVDFFGYDILTALKAVALTTPSEDFKEFIDGFVSTIETGGDLKDYLAQKSSEALLNYRLERQQYVESLSTYSDIYTGVLIAAPLFFVTALSLVSVLGGTIGGLSVNTIITLGTYIIIPGLNLIFLVFLELNQPEI